MTKRRTIVLFDIDLTLMRVGASRTVLNQALETATGVPGLVDGIGFAGRSDRWIITEAARLAELPIEGLFERCAAIYPQLLEAALATAPDPPLPGAISLLEALAGRPDTMLGIVTGNQRRTAEIKLTHGGLARYFDPLRGGFGDVHLERVGIVRDALAECRARPGDRVVVVGDTEHDVRSALAVDAIAVGVTTGRVSADALAVAGAHAVLLDLTDRDAAVRAILEAGPESTPSRGADGAR